jgi:hypothetical protein
MEVRRQEAGGRREDTNDLMKNKQRLCFAGVRLGKAYVSFYLMPVYVEPKLLDGISPELKKRMQGESCFKVASFSVVVQFG